MSTCASLKSGESPLMYYLWQCKLRWVIHITFDNAYDVT